METTERYYKTCFRELLINAVSIRTMSNDSGKVGHWMKPDHVFLINSLFLQRWQNKERCFIWDNGQQQWKQLNAARDRRSPCCDAIGKHPLDSPTPLNSLHLCFAYSRRKLLTATTSSLFYYMANYLSKDLFWARFFSME